MKSSVGVAISYDRGKQKFCLALSGEGTMQYRNCGKKAAKGGSNIFFGFFPQPPFSSGEARAQETFPIKEEGRRRKGRGFGKGRGNAGRNSYGSTLESANSSTLGDNAGGRGRRRISKRGKEGKKSLFVGESAKKVLYFLPPRNGGNNEIEISSLPKCFIFRRRQDKKRPFQNFSKSD